VTFTDTSSGGVTRWAWNFGDSTTSTAQNPTHTYSSPGTYTVTLTGTTATGTSATATKTITVNAPTSSKAVTYGGSTATGQTTTGTSVQLSVPSGTTAGDLLVASVTADAAPNLPAPSGWTSLATLRPSGASVFTFYHVVTAADAGRTTWTFTLSTAVKWSGGIARYLNVNTSSPIDGTVRSTTSSGAVTSVSVPAVTTTTSGALLVGGIGADSGKVAGTPPGGFTESFENALGQLAESAYAPTTTIGSQGAKVWSITGGTVPMAAWTAALRPAP
jgi:PKD repeat protein